MSPTSSGALEVERYIGACLITSQNQGRNPRKSSGNLDGWVGGVPLISYHQQQRWRRHVDSSGGYSNANPLSRLAVHTQGAPLILSGNRYNNNPNNRRKHQQYPANRSNYYCNSGNNAKAFESAGNDAVSVASDESSGSNNSETCLPRIIKPRKRRKKDRKPPLPHLLRPSATQDDAFSTDASTSPDLDSPNIIAPYFEFFCNEPPPPDLHHSFEDLEDFEQNGNQAESTCQCRYCDPNGQIWDVERSCYSPFLTPIASAPVKYSSFSSSLLDCFSSLRLEDDVKLSPPDPVERKIRRDLEVSTEIVTSPNGHRDLEIRFFSQGSGTRTKGLVNRSGSSRDWSSANFGE